MFLPECVRLAREQPDLARLIEILDARLQYLSPGAVLRPWHFASFLQADLHQVRSIFELLADSGALRRQHAVECERCQNLTFVADHQNALTQEKESLCSQCGDDLVSQPAARVTVYRLSASTLRFREASAMDFSSSVTPPSSNTGFDEPLSPGFVQDVFKYTHLLHYYSNDRLLKEQQPFANKRLVLVLHFLRDLLPFVEGMVRLGLEPQNTTLFYKDYPYPQKRAVAAWLIARGFHVFPRSAIEAFLKQLAEGASERVGQLLIIEDGGFFVPAIHTRYSDLIAHTVGAVEQTTRGIMNARDTIQQLEGKPLSLPILSVATSKLKSDFEPPYIARAIIKNIERLLPHLVFSGKKVAVLGCGNIGQQVLTWLRQNGADITVYDQDPNRRFWAQQNGIPHANTAPEAVQGKSFVIGCSGRRSVDSVVISGLAHGTYLVSASSELYEIDLEQLEQQARRKQDLQGESGQLIGTNFILPPNNREIHLLANGYPINFWGMDSMPEEASDLVMTLLFLAAVELARGNYRTPGINDQAINELADEQHHNLAGTFLNLHRQG
jgi:S-adenosylhomocysteine hydrolase